MAAQRRSSERYDIDSLTDVALGVFAQKGYDGASMDDVARAARITKASIYHHVPGKEALLDRGLGRALDALFAVLEEPGGSNGRAIDRLRHIVRRVAEVTLQSLPELSVLVRVRGNSPTEVRAMDRRRRFDRVVADLMREAIREGDLRKDVDPRVMTRLIFGMSNSVVEWFRPGRDVSAGQLVENIVGFAMRAVGV